MASLFNKRSVGQRKRKSKEAAANLFLELIWFIIKWSFMIAFFPITIIYYVFFRKK